MGCSIPGLSLPNTPATEVKSCRLPSDVIFVRKLLLGVGRPLRCLCIGRLPPGAAPGLQATRRAWSQVLISDRGCKDRRKAPETTSPLLAAPQGKPGLPLLPADEGTRISGQVSDHRLQDFTWESRPLGKMQFPTNRGSLHCVY